MVRFQQKVRKRFKNQVSVNLVFINIMSQMSRTPSFVSALFLPTFLRHGFVLLAVFSHLDVLKGCILIFNIVFYLKYNI